MNLDTFLKNPYLRPDRSYYLLPFDPCRAYRGVGFRLEFLTVGYER
jgi:hypothetical protein